MVSQDIRRRNGREGEEILHRRTFRLRRNIGRRWRETTVPQFISCSVPILRQQSLILGSANWSQTRLQRISHRLHYQVANESFYRRNKQDSRGFHGNCLKQEARRTPRVVVNVDVYRSCHVRAELDAVPSKRNGFENKVNVFQIKARVSHKKI